MSLGKISLMGGLRNVEHELSRSRLGQRLDTSIQGLTDRCVIAIPIICCGAAMSLVKRNVSKS